MIAHSRILVKAGKNRIHHISLTTHFKHKLPGFAPVKVDETLVVCPHRGLHIWLVLAFKCRVKVFKLLEESDGCPGSERTGQFYVYVGGPPCHKLGMNNAGEAEWVVHVKGMNPAWPAKFLNEEAYRLLNESGYRVAIGRQAVHLLPIEVCLHSGI